jgi:transposase
MSIVRFLSFDNHADTLVPAIAEPDGEVRRLPTIPNRLESLRNMVEKLGPPEQLRACYEAGPTGYELARLLARLHVGCQVIAPTLIPTAPGDRVKTDSRDCRRLARLHRAGELVAIRIPTVAEEAVRDLCRARADLLEDRTRARHRLSKFLLRHGRVFRAGSAWTYAHERWLVTQRFDDPALTATYNHYRATLDARDAQLEAIQADLATWYGRPPFADQVARLAAYRGVTRLGALTLASEVADWRRFASAGQFMGLLRLGPERILQRQLHLARPHHQVWQRPPAHPAGRVRLGLPAPTPGHPGTAPPPAGPATRDRRPGLDRPAAVVRPVRSPAGSQERQAAGGHRGRSRAGRLPVGRDDC